MELPVSIPAELSFLKNAKDEKELFTLLTKDTRQLVEFFDGVLFDQTWSRGHPELMQMIVEHLSSLFLDENLSIDLAKKAVELIHENNAFLVLKTPKDLLVHLKEGEDTVNALLFSLTSPEFYNIGLAAAGKGKVREIYFPKAHKPIFEIVKTFIERGSADDLWRHEYDEVLEVYKFSIEWEIKELEQEAAKVLKRYLTKQNYQKILLQILENGWQEYYLEVLKVANTYDLGVVFHEMPVDFLKIEFTDYREAAMDLFEVFKPWITHVGFLGPIIEDPRFSQIIRETPKLIGLSLSEIKYWSDRLQDIPHSIEELDLAMNSWLTSDNLKILLRERTRIEHLNLKSCINLDFKGFGLLKTLPALESLILTKCSQIKDEDILLICQCAPRLLMLDLEACERLTDRSLEIIAKHLYRLENLSLSRLQQITDIALIDLCHRVRNLHYLNLERCADLSDKGILEAVQINPSLRILNLSHTNISPEIKAQLTKIRPSLKIID